MGPSENCGIAAAAFLKGHTGSLFANQPGHDVAQLIPRILLDLQHRGELSAGFTTYNPHRPLVLSTYTDLGAVAHVFALFDPAKSQTLCQQYGGTAGIGHTRYATCGADDRTYAQPFERVHGRRWKWFSICFNGNLANFQNLKESLTSQRDYHLVRSTDTEVILHHIALALSGNRRRDLARVFGELSRLFDGAYNLGYINADGDVAIVRDPMGFRPLCYGVEGDLFAAASESVALANLGFGNIKEVEPGALVMVRSGKVCTRRYASSPRLARCFFEWIYFANAASIIGGRSVYQARANLGAELARLEKVPADKNTIVVPVPDCAKAAGDAMAYGLGVPSVEGLLRNRYIGRTFIQGAGREEKARRKYTPLREVLHGKRIILVEDSIVRLTTLRQVIRQIRQCGALEVHVRSTAPPIFAPCFYGIDMSTIGELFAPRFMKNPVRELLPAEVTDVMSKDMGADTLTYLPVELVPSCIGLPEEELCMACLTTQYPTEHGQRQYDLALRNWRDGRKGRTYEQKDSG
jgi:amidophosphoribosyltransferase